MATSSNISWLKTIRTKIITATIVTTTLVLGVSGYFAYKYTETSKSQELQQLAEVTADRLSQHLEVPMWDVDYDQVGKLLEAEMKELKIGNPESLDTDIGPIINNISFKKLSEYIEKFTMAVVEG